MVKQAITENLIKHLKLPKQREILKVALIAFIVSMGYGFSVQNIISDHFILHLVCLTFLHCWPSDYSSHILLI